MTTVVETVRAIFFFTNEEETVMIEKDKREENTKKKTRECGDRYKIIYVGNLPNRWAGFDRVRD